ncbi:MAG: hypothetical protein M1546_25415, partial [Chloroflexi bacterium]|nr:hypothetical protein [Chloroflexota bacterium]
MPKLPTPLFDAVVKQLLPRVRTFDDRTALLTPLLNTERIYDDIKWEGTANAFATQLVERLQHEHLIALLRRLDVGAEQQADIEALCTQIAAAVSGGDRGGPDPYAAALAVYRRGVIALWSQPRFQIDTRFVRITLLVDQGRDAQGTRFVEPPGAREYNDLRE